MKQLLEKKVIAEKYYPFCYTIATNGTNYLIRLYSVMEIYNVRIDCDVVHMEYSIFEMDVRNQLSITKKGWNYDQMLFDIFVDLLKLDLQKDGCDIE